MNTRTQKTIARSISCQGIGVHSAAPVTLTLSPLPVQSGIILERTDLKENNRIPARFDQVVDTRNCTTLANAHGVTISTIEHVMAALCAYGITNVLIGISSPEVPIMDGSSAPFMDMIEKAGVTDQGMPAMVIRIEKPVEVRHENRFVRLEPAQNFTSQYSFDFNGRQNLAPQSQSYIHSLETFRTQICEARSFGFYEDAQKLWAMGLAKGSSLENAVVIDNGAIMNPEGLRYQNEMVRHKILDALGDLYLAGAQIQGHLISHNGGHEMNNLILRSLFADASAYTIINGTISQDIAVVTTRPHFAA